MKTILSKLPLLILFIFPLSLIAQDVTFKILAARGDVAIQQKGSDDFVRARTGTVLKNTDKIILNEKAYAGLVSSQGKTIELKEEGMYDVKDFTGDIKADNSGITQKYVAYVFDHLRAGNDVHAHNMNITGSVERSAEEVNYDLLLPSETRLIPLNSEIYWKPRKEKSSQAYTLKIFNLFDEVVAEFQTENTSVMANLESIELKANELYKIQVFSNDGKAKSNVVTARVPSMEDVVGLKARVMELNQALDPNSALANIVFATYLETQGLYLSAIPYYKKAIELQPDVEEYQAAYNAFMDKMGLKTI